MDAPQWSAYSKKTSGAKRKRPLAPSERESSNQNQGLPTLTLPTAKVELLLSKLDVEGQSLGASLQNGLPKLESRERREAPSQYMCQPEPRNVTHHPLPTTTNSQVSPSL